MEVGQNGAPGVIAPNPVEVESNKDPGTVTTQYLDMEDKTVLELEHRYHLVLRIIALLVNLSTNFFVDWAFQVYIFSSHQHIESNRTTDWIRI